MKETCQDLQKLLADPGHKFCKVNTLASSSVITKEILTHLHRNERILNELKNLYSKGNHMDSTTQIVVRTERGWAGHFCGSFYCGFHRNTLLEFGETKLVISTVGNYRPPLKEKIETIGHNRYYETMVFGAKKDGPYWEANVRDEYSIDSEWGIWAESVEQLPDNVDNKADLLHETVVEEFIDKLLTGKIK